MNIVLDWAAYFEEFCRIHGEPVEHGGRLLFPDGWTYAKDNPAGPEFPPPADPNNLRLLQHAYWSQRKQQIEGELDLLSHALRGYQQLQRSRSAQLCQRSVYYDEDLGRWVSQVGSLNLSDLQGRLDWCRADLAECDRQLASLAPNTTKELINASD